VNSPTFVLINEYAGRLTLFHIDAYRLAGPDQLSALGFEEMCQAGGVVIVEWADRASSIMPSNSTWIEISATSESARELRISSKDADCLSRLRQLDLS
jgi:tRNA threonylcarbamoyladenosine biosynthesis protein TsaE